MAEEKKCKYCSMDIPDSAKICPYCRKRQGIPMFVFILAPIAALIILFIIFLSIPPFMGNENIKHGLPSSYETYEEKAKQVAEELKRKQIENDSLIQLSDRGKEIKASHQDWTNQQCNDIADKKVWLGMTANQALISWGKPKKVNKRVSSSGTDEQWVYPGHQYLYFENDILKSLQQ